MSTRRRIASWSLLAAVVATFCLLALLPSEPSLPSARRPGLTWVESRNGALVRGPRNQNRLALVFTAHEFGEGGETILAALGRHRWKASFFFTGDFLRNPAFAGISQRVVQNGHLLGPHSDKHLLYCAWDDAGKTLVTREQFLLDLERNRQETARFTRQEALYLLPPFEHHNLQIAEWTREAGFTLINFTPGTRSSADYTGEADTNFVSSQAIFDSIVDREQRDPNGLNGFLLLLHLGSGPRRADKFQTRFADLLDFLAASGYTCVRVDDLLGKTDRATAHSPER